MFFCAMCGIRMITPDGHTILEAAHIKPWALSRDDLPTNGLALCRLCHWSFDEGLMRVGKDYEVLVSKQAKNDPNIPGPIMTLQTGRFSDHPNSSIGQAKTILIGTGELFLNDLLQCGAIVSQPESYVCESPLNHFTNGKNS